MPPRTVTILKSSYCEDTDTDTDIYNDIHNSDNTDSTNIHPNNGVHYEIGVDEAGRGPMLGRVYASAAVLPKSMEQFNHALMKDSKKFHSEKKIKEVADYIKQNAIAWSVQYSDEGVIDKINIRNATHKAMHAAIKEVIEQLTNKNNKEGLNEVDHKVLLLVDGNDFTPLIDTSTGEKVSHVCIEGGDNTYSCIAAASILAKVSRDEYIAELCSVHPILNEHYGILKNKGYGTKIHMDGIKQHGITPFHRKSFGICRSFH
jgi:ribonuclease HII